MPSQDRKLISNEKWEPRTVASYYKIPIATVRKAKEYAGRSRKIVYEILRSMGFDQIKPQKLTTKQKEKLIEAQVKMGIDPELSRQNFEAGL